MRRIWRVSPALLSLCLTPSFAQQQQPQQQSKLAFLTPNTVGTTEYSIGEEIGIRWSSPYEFTTLEVLQGPAGKEHSFAIQTLKANASHAITMHTWTATPVSNLPLTVPIRFRLQKGDQPNQCADCTVISAPFLLSDGETSSAAGGGDTYEGGGNSLSKAGIIGVGVGIGVGAVAIAAFIGALFCIDKQHGQRKKKRRKEREKKRGRDRHPLISFSRARPRWESELFQEYPRPREPVLQPQRQQRAWSSWTLDSVATSASGRPKSYIEAFEFEDLDGGVREEWYELRGDGKWKASRKMEMFEEAEGFVKETSLDQNSSASSSAAAKKVPEEHETAEGQSRYELAGSEVGIAKPQRVMRLTRF